jgi:hypothetical protein
MSDTKYRVRLIPQGGTTPCKVVSVGTDSSDTNARHGFTAGDSVEFDIAPDGALIIHKVTKGEGK